MASHNLALLWSSIERLFIHLNFLTSANDIVDIVPIISL